MAELWRADRYGTKGKTRMLRAGAVAGLVACLALAHHAAGSPQKGRKTMSHEETADPAAEEQISKWLGVVWRIPPEAYLDVNDFSELPDGVRVQQDSVFWAAKFFSEAANPYHLDRKARRSIHRATPETFDAVRHEYQAGAQRLVVEETANFFLIGVDWPPGELAELAEPAKRDAINQIAGVILKMAGTMVAPNLQDAPYSWIFQFPAEVREGTRFSTDSTQDPRRMWSWASRLDGGIHKNRLFFLCFKKRESTSGKSFLPDGKHWFDGGAWAGADRGR